MEVTAVTGAITGINALGLAFLLICGVLIFFVSSRYVHVPITFACLYMTIGQQTLLFGLFHFTPMRILFLLGWIRLIFRREFNPIQFNIIDKAIVVWMTVHFTINVVFLYGTEAGLVNQLGFVYDAAGMYFFYRIVIKDFEDAEEAVKVLATLLVPLAIIMIFEKLTGRNIFAFFGGVPEISEFRDFGYRSQGPFRSPIIAGSFGATMFPLFIGLWWKEEGGKLYSLMGIIGSTIITVVAHSGGPLSAYTFGIISLLFWRYKYHMKTIRWFILFTAISLHLIMSAPIWHLFSRISGFVGGTGWHRAHLIDMAIEHFNEWWLVGTTYTAHWMPYSLVTSPGHSDITNQFILEGINGGLITMILYIVFIITLFRGVGNGLSAAEELDLPFDKIFFVWSMGAAMVTQVLTLTSITYFDQMNTFFYLLVAMVSQANNLIYRVQDLQQEEDTVS